MNLSTLSPAKGSKRERFRKGRGHGSGNGKTAGKGHKGQKARSGAPRPGFEGGQLPLYMRLPKRGFTNINAKDIVAINIDRLEEKFNDGDVVTVEALMEKGIIKKPRDGVKILGNGKLTKELTVEVHAFSKSAVEQILACGGKAVVLIKAGQLQKFYDGDTVTKDALLAKRIINNPKVEVKILANGRLTKKLTVQANAFSEGAAERIEALGGKAEVI